MFTDAIEGVPVPEHNLLCYRSIFAVEQWLRRIATAAVAARIGPAILGGLDSDLTAELKKRLAQLPKRGYLGVDMAREPMWLTTMDELRALLVSDRFFPTVRRLTTFERDLLESKIDEIREIRNIVGHNRGVSHKTWRILEAALLSLEEGVSIFRESFTPDASGVPPRSKEPAGDLQVIFERELDLVSTTGVAPERLFLRATDVFHFACVAPRHASNAQGEGEGEGEIVEDWLDLKSLTAAMDPVRNILVAIVVPERGTSFSLAWPTAAGDTDSELVVRTFVSSVAKVWGTDRFEDQDQRVFQDPKLWLIPFQPSGLA